MSLTNFEFKSDRDRHVRGSDVIQIHLETRSDLDDADRKFAVHPTPHVSVGHDSCRMRYDSQYPPRQPCAAVRPQ